MSSSSSKRLIAAVVAAACATFAAQAEEFSWQLSGGGRDADTGDFSASSWALDATYYMTPIDDSAGPFALASFLNPTTRVSAAATQSESSDRNFNDPTAYTLSGAYVLPGEKWYVGGEYARSHVDDGPTLSQSGPKGYGVSAGRYLNANTTLELRFGRSEQESSVSCEPSFVCIGAPFEIETTTDSVGLEVLHVRRFRSLTYALRGSVSETDADAELRVGSGAFAGASRLDGLSTRTYAVGAELFPTERLGVRVGYSRPDGAFDVDGYDVGATWFFKPRVAVRFGLSRTTLHGAPSGLGHTDSAGVQFIGRL